MNKELGRFLAVLVLAVNTTVFTGPAKAVEIADWSFSHEGGFGPWNGDPPINTGPTFYLRFFELLGAPTKPSPTVELLVGNVSPTDTFPRAFSWTSMDTGFSEAVALLTNGLDDDIAVSHEFPSGAGGSDGELESLAFLSDPGFSDPDLMGSVIDSITLEISQLSNSVRPPLFGTGDLFITEYSGRVIIRGTPAPVPATMLLLGIGLVGTAFARRQVKASR